MPGLYSELGTSITFTHFGELRANASGKLVVVVKLVFECHGRLCEVGFGEEGELFEHNCFFSFFGWVGAEYEYSFTFP